MSDEIKREFIFATYCKSKESDQDDLLVVKEKLHHPDGRITDNLRQIPNYQRTFYVTKKEHRNHQQKKEFEYIENCDMYTCTQAEMVKKAGRVSGNWKARYLGEVNESPYVYGTDITTPVLLCEEYGRLWPELVSDSSLAIMDYETDVVRDTGEIIAGTITYKDKVCLVATEEFMSEFKSKDRKKLVQTNFTKYLGEVEKARNIKLEFETCETPADCVIALFKRAHSWHPDFLGFWNMKFDIGKVLYALDKARAYWLNEAVLAGRMLEPTTDDLGNVIAPPLAQTPEAIEKYSKIKRECLLKARRYSKEQVFSDPSVPDEFKFFYWKEDELIKVTADGKRTSKHVADLWHKISHPSSFTCVDLMCLFKRLRVREKQRTSYSLDATLGDELNLSKLKFDEADGLVGLDWHYKMQTDHKLEYLIYCGWDGISVEILDEKTNDVSKGLRANVGISEISRFNSNPKRLSDAMYFILKEEGKIIGSVSKDMTEELDKFTPNKNGWIITLPAELQVETGRKLISEYPVLETNIITHAFDIDIESGYPTFGAISNVSKGTSRFEVCGISGLHDQETRSIGINLSALKTNSLEIANKVYSFPRLEDLEREFLKEISLPG